MLTSICCLMAGISNAQTPTITNSSTLQTGANFNIDGTGAAKTFSASATTSDGGVRYMMTLNTANRWGLGTAVAESGTARQGSDFAIYGYDGPTFLGRYFTIMRNNGFTGINAITPTAQLHVTAGAGNPLARFTYSDVAETDAALSFLNHTGVGGSYIPNISGRAYSPGRPYGITIIGEAEDIAAPANELFCAAIMLDGRTKTRNRLNTANIFAVNNYGNTMLMIKSNGNVGIGTTDPGTNRLAVEGTIAGRRVKVTQATAWPDYVFEPDYALPSLQSIEAFIRENKHLPEVPSAKQITADGQDLGDMNTVLLKKVEELTLYLIAMQKEIAEVKASNITLADELKAIRETVNK